ncbi:uncharacterized protein LOC110189342 [Drosophila serrata]|uniref:uncharacterized protein LOC110189342 n=1 Tax=Drosophila serrata TaxID=7274 RepID=UPI000A1D1FE0|nr:uncharacterized protein LOC110189342 [Drosophila serrata]
MSDKKLEKQQSDTKNITHDIPGKSISHVSCEEPRILSELGKTVVPPEAYPFKGTLRQLICSIQAKMRPRDSSKLPRAELSCLVRHGDVVLRRLRRLLDSRRRFIEFKPMMPLQEAIAQELAQELGCQTRFYNGWDESRYMVAYRPGVEPNAFELRARGMCQKERDFENFNLEEAIEFRLEPMSFRNDKLHWHQPIKLNYRQMAANSPQDSLSLGKKILEKFKGKL